MTSVKKPSFAVTHPDLAAQAVGWDPTTFMPKSREKVQWNCNLGHKWFATVNTRIKGHGCSVCTNRTINIGRNDLATTHPEIAAQAHGWDPTTVLAGSDRILSWKCENEHVWKSRVANRKTGHGCPNCHFKIVVGENDLATTHPEIAAQAHGWDPTTLSSGSNKKVLWLCNFGHTWRTTPAKRVKGSGCSTCSNKVLLIGFNDLATTHPEIAAQAHGWDPTIVMAGSTRKHEWKCAFGHFWTAQLSNRRNGTGCPSCADSGFDPNKAAFLYFIDHFDLEMFQIGITNDPVTRLAKHGRKGWEVRELRGPMDGHLTQKIEIDCLHSLKKRGAILGHKAGFDKFDGYSEAWTKASLNVTSIKQMLDWVYDDEAK